MVIWKYVGYICKWFTWRQKLFTETQRVHFYYTRSSWNIHFNVYKYVKMGNNLKVALPTIKSVKMFKSHQLILTLVFAGWFSRPFIKITTIGLFIWSVIILGNDIFMFLCISAFPIVTTVMVLHQNVWKCTF